MGVVEGLCGWCVGRVYRVRGIVIVMLRVFVDGVCVCVGRARLLVSVWSMMGVHVGDDTDSLGRPEPDTTDTDADWLGPRFQVEPIPKRP